MMIGSLFTISIALNGAGWKSYLSPSCSKRGALAGAGRGAWFVLHVAGAFGACATEGTACGFVCVTIDGRGMDLGWAGVVDEVESEEVVESDRERVVVDGRRAEARDLSRSMAC